MAGQMMPPSPESRSSSCQGMPQKLSQDTYLDWVSRCMMGTVQDAAHGQLELMAQHHFSRLGKMVRARFVAQLGRCYQLPAKITLDWAVACELLHNATLVHDDLQDGDTVRRGVPALWAKFGANQAINFGDFLLTLAPSPILYANLPDPIKLRLMAKIVKMSSAIANGQVAELELNRLLDSDHLIERYLECSAGKTSALFAGLAQGVAMIADRDPAEQELLAKIFTPLGQLFQIQDDILDLYGDKGRGEVGCDIKEGKVSFLIACHLNNHPADFAVIREALQRPREQTTDEMVLEIKALFDRKGTLDHAFREVEARLLEIHAALAELDQPSLKLDALVRQLTELIFEPISHLADDPLLSPTARVFGPSSSHSRPIGSRTAEGESVL